MTPERWAAVERIYHTALEKRAAERGPFLAEACAGDSALRREVESLLEHDGSAAFLSTPAAAQASGIVASGSSLIGQTVGPYVISDALGAGGMGEVYRARDQRLGRDVAIKILPTAFTSDPERLARFGREARVLAALNHPHIGGIYGLENVPSTGSGQAAMPALVLELVEGLTLADRIQHGRIPTADALVIARQIAEALEAAHDKGITHRDLKPANIKIMAVSLKLGADSIEASAPQALFSIPQQTLFEVAPDGQRFLVEMPDSTPHPLTVIVNLAFAPEVEGKRAIN